ncbi:hypothetical protein [Paenibacillus gallinarum]|uniref:Uncharacterized protein n=1 Tax=Paenibacillus gallinarum TaxID=2762232 RepID=A0ABR8T3A8_9BACL|nr:hypothetical protein [Paenibacillus gallinarum]MBD7970240.1 hypothetical protein [Paenibacillus gallinarum]
MKKVICLACKEISSENEWSAAGIEEINGISKFSGGCPTCHGEFYKQLPILIALLLEDNKGNFPYRSLVGGHQYIFHDQSKDTYCTDCANKSKEEITGVMVHLEGESLQCKSCNKEIKSEYANNKKAV